MIASELVAISFTRTQAFNHLLFTINQLLCKSDEVKCVCSEKKLFSSEEKPIMVANTPSQDLQNICIRFNQLSDDVKKQFLEEQLKILNNAPWP